MISIGKVRDAGYYLTEVTSDDAHAYYADPERLGRWHGTLAVDLGLQGQVDPDHFRDLLVGLRPGSGERLAVTAVRMAALDLTLSVPKSVSVLWATTGHHARVAIEQSLDAAERAVVQLLEDEAVFVRRGHAGAELAPGGGIVAASFDHRTSREGDPNLHRHLVVANASRGPDDRITGLDTRQLYRIRYSADSVFQAVLRHELTHTLGCHFDPVDRHGVAEITGVDKPVRDEFSRRRAAIEAEMGRRGATTGRGARLAALTTRPAKPEEPSEHVLLAEWRYRARAIGFDPATVPLEPRQPELAIDPQQLGFELTERDSTFGRWDVLRNVARAAGDGIGYDRIVSETDEFLASPEVVELADGVYTTPEILALESRCVEIAVTGERRGCGLVAEHETELQIAIRPQLDDDQRDLVRTVTTSGSEVEVIIGPPGTGKTFSLDAVHAAYRRAGHRLIGAALAARAAAELEAGTGIRSSTIDRLLHQLERGTVELNEWDVVVVDEAAMVGTRQLARLIEATHQADAKIVLVGDSAQLPAIDAGGTFAAIANRIEPIRLHTNRRQTDADDRAALRALRAGDIDTAIEHWQTADRIHTYDTAADVIEGIVDAWYATDQAGETSAMVAARHDQRRQLNNAARARLTADGHLGDTVWNTPDLSFAIGDRIVACRNDYTRGLINGQFGTVVDSNGRGLVIEHDGDHQVVPYDYIADDGLTHAYAITVHKSQGATVDHLYLLADDGIYNELGYTATSRGRTTNHLHLTAAVDEHGHPADDPLQDLRYGLNISRAKRAAIDHQPLEPAIESPGIDLW